MICSDVKFDQYVSYRIGTASANLIITGALRHKFSQATELLCPSSVNFSVLTTFEKISVLLNLKKD